MFSPRKIFKVHIWIPARFPVSILPKMLTFKVSSQSINGEPRYGSEESVFFKSRARLGTVKKGGRFCQTLCFMVCESSGLNEHIHFCQKLLSKQTAVASISRWAVLDSESEYNGDGYLLEKQFWAKVSIVIGTLETQILTKILFFTLSILVESARFLRIRPHMMWNVNGETNICDLSKGATNRF